MVTGQVWVGEGEEGRGGGRKRREVKRVIKIKSKTNEAKMRERKSGRRERAREKDTHRKS